MQRLLFRSVVVVLLLLLLQLFLWFYVPFLVLCNSFSHSPSSQPANYPSILRFIVTLIPTISKLKFTHIPLLLEPASKLAWLVVDSNAAILSRLGNRGITLTFEKSRVRTLRKNS